MRRRRREQEEAYAEPTQLLPQAAAVPLVHNVAADPEVGHFRHPPYSIWGGMKFILILSVMLWWLPTFGQMIAGYIGGRRAGGPWRGVAASIAPVLLIVVLASGAERGLLSPWLEGLVAIPALLAQGIAIWFPPSVPYIEFVLAYLVAFVDALKATLAMGSNGYLVTIVFAYIGGILADQARREASYGRGTNVGISITQPLVAPFRQPYPTWEARHPERFEAFHRLPVANARPLLPAGKPVRRAHKVDARAADAGDDEGGRSFRDAKKAERKELTAHDKELATRRFVERALRQYEAAHRR